MVSKEPIDFDKGIRDGIGFIGKNANNPKSELEHLIYIFIRELWSPLISKLCHFLVV